MHVESGKFFQIRNYDISLASEQLIFVTSLLFFQRLRLDQTSKVDPLTLLDRISREGISQEVCINDLGKHKG